MLVFYLVVDVEGMHAGIAETSSGREKRTLQSISELVLYTKYGVL